MTEPAITPELVAKHGLTPDEYAHAKEILGGREPSYTELGIFSVMWSEHCSYKNTRPLLKTFPTKSPKILVGAGEENAGIIDIGDGLAIAFKIESHNHPSAVEPFQGAATGVGGIIRDIFTMGARPVCAINSLRFGPIVDSPDGNGNGTTANNRRLFSGVVSGIAHYGNCFGIPTIAGEVYFDKCYEGNPLVNAFCLGVLRHDQIARGAAKGLGNPVFYVGPATGRDGLAGAAFASQDLTQESADKQRGAVQVGDPFMEKLVCEACLELLATGAVAGIQDMGAAGLTCSTCETAARAGTGIEIELNKVPQRAPNMTPYEIMLSESQERMLIIVQAGREHAVKRIFNKWDLPWAEVGFVTDTGRMVVRHETDFRPRQIPLVENAFHLGFAAFVDDDEHPLLRFAQHDFVARHVRRALRNFVEFDLDSRARARRRFTSGTRQTRRAHVLNSRDATRRQKFEARFANQFFHERIADLHRAALLLGGFLGQIFRRKRRARETVATRCRTDIENWIADSLRRAARDLFVPQNAEAKRVHEWIAFVGYVEINLARDGWNSKTISVMRDAVDHTGEKAAVIYDLRFTIYDFKICAFGDRILSALTPALSPGERAGVR